MCLPIDWILFAFFLVEQQGMEKRVHVLLVTKFSSKYTTLNLILKDPGALSFTASLILAAGGPLLLHGPAC